MSNLGNQKVGSPKNPSAQNTVNPSHTFYDTLRDNNPDPCCSSFIRNHESIIMQSEQPVSRRTMTSIPISGKLDDRENIRKAPYKLEELPESLRSLLLQKKEPSGGGGSLNP